MVVSWDFSAILHGQFFTYLPTNWLSSLSTWYLFQIFLEMFDCLPTCSTSGYYDSLPHGNLFAFCLKCSLLNTTSQGKIGWPGMGQIPTIHIISHSYEQGQLGKSLLQGVGGTCRKQCWCPVSGSFRQPRGMFLWDCGSPCSQWPLTVSPLVKLSLKCDFVILFNFELPCRELAMWPQQLKLTIYFCFENTVSGYSHTMPRNFLTRCLHLKLL